jgi:plastocyanin
VRRTLKLLILLAVVAVVAAGCADDGGGDAAAAGPASTAAPRGSGGGGGGGGGRGDYGGGGGDGVRSEPTSSRGSATSDADADDARIVSFAFTPRTVSAKVGQRVKWEHQDPGVTHTVAAVDGAFRSGELQAGDEFSHLFRTAGSFAYRCSIHPDMQGTVKVGG